MSDLAQILRPHLHTTPGTVSSAQPPAFDHDHDSIAFHVNIEGTKRETAFVFLNRVLSLRPHGPGRLLSALPVAD